MNATPPNASQLNEKTRTFLDSWAPAIGPSGADCRDGWQIYHRALRAVNLCPRKGWDDAKKEKPPRTLVAYGKALEGALDAQAIVGLEFGQARRGEGRIWSEANRARLVQMHIHELCADIEAPERGPTEVRADPRFLEV